MFVVKFCARFDARCLMAGASGSGRHVVVPLPEARDSTATRAKRVADAVQDNLGHECCEGTMMAFVGSCLTRSFCGTSVAAAAPKDSAPLGTWRKPSL